MKAITVMWVCEKYVVGRVYMFLCWKWLLDAASNWNNRRTIPEKRNF